MQISKTAFKEYSRCSRVLPLERIYFKKLESIYNNEDKEKILELLSYMFSGDEGEDLLDEADLQLEALLPYYSEVEKWSLNYASEQFGLDFKFHEETKDQKCFSFRDQSNNSFYCYLDGYFEGEDQVYVIEVKATTSRKFKELGPKVKGEVDSIFEFKDNIYRLRNFSSKEMKANYQRHYQKLYNRYSDVGSYVYDIAVERYIIERSIRQSHPELIGKKVNYYLAVLNNDYIFDGTYQEGSPVYGITKDASLISFIEMNEVTESYLQIIDDACKQICNQITNNKLDEAQIGPYCEFGQKSGCLYTKVCFPELSEKGSILEYLYFKGITGPDNKRYSKFELINQNKKRLIDIPRAALSNPNQIIQRNCFEKAEEYLNHQKIKAGLQELEYPLYYLDFESFPCPLPRFKGEKPYSQSLFQYSIHLEAEPGDCDEIKDNYSFLVRDFQDHREELVLGLIKNINLDRGGSVIVYNKSFEYTRIKELMALFPKYQEKLKKINDSLFDLMDLVKTRKDFYLDLGFGEEESRMVNYYHNDLAGKYSIKRVLPLFSDLSYQDLEVKDGTEAIALYASFKNLPEEDIEKIRDDLIKYCRQDTWAMVLILKGLKEKIKKI